MIVNSNLNSIGEEEQGGSRILKEKKRDRIPESDRWLKIGEVADLSGMPVKTIRYYEEIGLLEPTTTRSQSGYRLFKSQALNRLAFIKRAQSLGLSLSEIQSILEVHDSDQLPCGAMKQLLLHKVNAIAEQIEALEILKSELVGLLSGWQEQPPSHHIAQTICPNIQSPRGDGEK